MMFFDNLKNEKPVNPWISGFLIKAGSQKVESEALGNQDFDYGLERTNELQQLANFPMRAANITVKETGDPIYGEP